MAKELLSLLSTNRPMHRVCIYFFCVLHYNLCILLLCFLAGCKQRSTPPSALRTRLLVQMSMERNYNYDNMLCWRLNFRVNKFLLRNRLHWLIVAPLLESWSFSGTHYANLTKRVCARGRVLLDLFHVQSLQVSILVAHMMYNNKCFFFPFSSHVFPSVFCTCGDIQVVSHISRLPKEQPLQINVSLCHEQPSSAIWMTVNWTDIPR